VRQDFRILNALSSPLSASRTAVGYDVPMISAASAREIILARPFAVPLVSSSPMARSVSSLSDAA
jgi:hypothetical protein